MLLSDTGEGSGDTSPSEKTDGKQTTEEFAQLANMENSAATPDSMGMHLLPAPGS
jgi:hypothetical protein